MDALSIVPKGQADTGEAAVLGRGNQAQFGQMIIGERMRQLKEQQVRDADMKALLSDEVKAKWASDNINYFQPKIEELKKKTIDMYRQKNGKLSDIDMFELKQNWAKLKSEAEVSNALYAEEQDRIKELSGDPEFKKFDQDSWQIRKAWNNPYEQFGAEIEKAGGIIPWRAQNSQAFTNLGAYSLDTHLQDKLKDKSSKWFIRDEKGKVKSYTDPKTGLVVSEFREGVDPQKLAEHIGTIWNDPKDWQSKRMRGLAANWVQDNFKIYDDGTVAPQSKEAMEVVKNAPNLKGLTPDQMKAVLGKQYVIEEAKIRFPSKEGIMTEKPININTGDGGGGGGATPDMFNWATGLQKEAPFQAPKVTPDIAKTLVGSDSPESIEKAQAIANEHYKKRMAEYSNKPYVSMTFKDGRDNPRLTYQGFQYISNGFVRKNGKWYMVGTEEMGNGNSLAEIIQAAKNDGGIFSTKQGKEPKKDLSVREIPLSADVAVKHGFTGVNAIPNLIKFLNTQVPQDY